MKTYKTKSNAVRAAKVALGADAKEGVHFDVSEMGFDNTYYVWDAKTASCVYKAPGAPAGFLSTMLGTVSRDTLMYVSPECGTDMEFQSRYRIGLTAGMRLGVVGERYDPATRTQKHFIVR